MQSKIHPQYYTQAKITCSTCKKEYEVGATAENMSIEVCGNCHPFYTGKYRIIDSTGRVEKFHKKYAQFFSTHQKKEENISPSSGEREQDEVEEKLVPVKKSTQRKK